MTKAWKTHKGTIIKLYKMEGMTLDAVQRKMAKEHGFDAGIRTYRIYLKKWNIRKYRKHATGELERTWVHRASRPRPPQAPSSRTVDMSEFDSRLMPAPQQTHHRSWLDSTGAFSPIMGGPWVDRSSSVSTSSDYASPGFDGRHLENPVLPVPDLGDGGHPASAARRDSMYLNLPSVGWWPSERGY